MDTGSKTFWAWLVATIATLSSEGVFEAVSCLVGVVSGVVFTVYYLRKIQYERERQKTWREAERKGEKET
ncbi:hypothetical protein [Vibrio coralliilyticus]|uniref:hypothetical protein n=1 Tax=Vibrio coralliilyticus TaxID=190893 RepID=UPI0018441141|nr:hypothetical protein [Vibrio coralliilyticus]NUW66947.1 hypothetical protein [Vibrio coralliilyticus]